MMKVYVAGSVSSEEEAYVVRDRFREACDKVCIEHKCETFNPLSIPENHGFDEPWGFYMRKSIAALVECDAIYVIPGSEGSKGVCIKRLVASVLGIERVYLDGDSREPDVFIDDLLKIVDGYCEQGDQERIAKVFALHGAACLAKNKDYGGAVWKKPVLAPELSPGDAIMVRMSDKVERLSSLLSSGDAPRVKESIEDTMADFGSYAFLWLARPKS